METQNLTNLSIPLKINEYFCSWWLLAVERNNPLPTIAMRKHDEQNSSYFIIRIRISRTTGTSRNWFLTILKILVNSVQRLVVKFAHESKLLNPGWVIPSI